MMKFKIRFDFMDTSPKAQYDKKPCLLALACFQKQKP